MSEQQPGPAGTTVHDNPKAAVKAAKVYAKASRPWYKKKRFIIPIALVVLMVIVAATSSGDTGPTTGGGGGGEGGDSAASQAQPVAVGETVSLEGTSYTVESVETTDTVGDEFFEEAAGGVYVVVELTIENTEDETKTFLDTAAKLIGSNDKTYSTDSDGTIAASTDGGSLIFEDMQPDVAKTGLLVFDVPGDAAPGATLEVSDLYGRGEAYIDLGL